MPAGAMQVMVGAGGGGEWVPLGAEIAVASHGA